MRHIRLVLLIAAMAMVASSCIGSVWGSNAYGQLGLDSFDDQSTPTVATDDLLDIAAGGFHTCWIPTDRSLWCTGDRGAGTSDGPTSFPIRIGTGTSWADVEAGDSHTCAIQTDQSLWCWGFNPEGQIGSGSTNPTTEPVTDPVRVSPGTSWRSVSPGTIHTCGIQTDNSLWCWGGNEFSLLGNGTTNNALHPERVGTDRWRSVGAALTTTCAVRDDHTLWCWGDFAYISGTDGVDIAPLPIQMGSAASWDVVDGAASWLRHCATQLDDSLWCWGDNNFGSNGDGTFDTAVEPTKVIGPSDWRTFSVGGFHTCGVRLDSTLWCWGSGNDGQLGLGQVDESNIPVRVGTANDWFTVDAGWQHTTGLSLPGPS